MPYKRILLKLSGAFFGDKNGTGLDLSAVETIAEEIITIHKEGIQIAVVNGAGNIFRGRSRTPDSDRVAADRIGLVATVPNAMALVMQLNAKGADTRLMNAFAIEGFARVFEPFRARKLLDENKILILSGGTGNTLFTTDTAAVLRALETQADVLVKATDVDGVYAEDPHKNSAATKYKTLTHQEAAEKKLNVMDVTAFTLASEHRLKIIVCKFEKGSLLKIIKNPSEGTMIESA